MSKHNKRTNCRKNYLVWKSRTKNITIWYLHFCFPYNLEIIHSKKQNIWLRESKVVRFERIYTIWFGSLVKTHSTKNDWKSRLIRLLKNRPDILIFCAKNLCKQKYKPQIMRFSRILVFNLSLLFAWLKKRGGKKLVIQFVSSFIIFHKHVGSVVKDGPNIGTFFRELKNSIHHSHSASNDTKKYVRNKKYKQKIRSYVLNEQYFP